MAKEYAKKFYNGKAWKKCRLSYISKVHGLCEHCNEPGYIVDHIIEITPDNINDADITFNHGNLQYLCLLHHNRKHFGNDTGVTRDGLTFVNGDIVKK